MTILAAAIAAIMAGTWVGFPTATAIGTGLVIGLGWPERSVRLAGLAGLLSWGLLLGLAAVRGDPVFALGARLGGAMELPAWAPFAATLLYPAVLSVSAAWIGQLVSPRRKPVSRAALYR